MAHMVYIVYVLYTHYISLKMSLSIACRTFSRKKEEPTTVNSSEILSAKLTASYCSFLRIPSLHRYNRLCHARISSKGSVSVLHTVWPASRPNSANREMQFPHYHRLFANEYEIPFRQTRSPYILYSGRFVYPPDACKHTHSSLCSVRIMGNNCHNSSKLISDSFLPIRFLPKKIPTIP